LRREENGGAQGGDESARGAGSGSRSAPPDDVDEIAEIEASLVEANLPPVARKAAERELRRLKRMQPTHPEFHVIRSYLELMAEMPWGKRDGEAIDIAKARKILDADHCGLQLVKRRILEFLAVQWCARRVGRGAAGSSTTAEQLTDAEAAAPSEEEEEEETSTAAASEKSIMVEAIVDRAKNIHSDPRATAPILLLVGPPGVGKTSLGVSVARALGRKFQRIALGGVQDEAELRGHRRTYIGSMPGRIVQALRRAGTSNPVILLDEVDKIGRGSIRGDPAAALLEILDPAQNSTFRDAYLDVPVDCSGVLFLATANSLEPIPAPLLDRTEVLRIPGYTLEEKLNIARNYLVPKQLEVHSIAGAVTFADDALAKLATDHTREAGVRGLERSVAAVCRHVALAIAEEQSSDQLVEEVEEEEVEVQGGGERTAVVASRLREFFPPDII